MRFRLTKNCNCWLARQTPASSSPFVCAFGCGSDGHRLTPPGQGQASEDVLLVVALCGSRLGSYVRHFGFCLKPVIQRVSVYSSALLVQLVSAASDLFFELSASLCSLLRRSESNGLGFHGDVPPMARSRVARLCAQLPVENASLGPLGNLHKLNTGQLRCSSFHSHWDCMLTQRWAAGGRVQFFNAK